jgi:hypothetical protein
MARLVNMLAFERRCIRSSFVVLPAMRGDTPCFFAEKTRSVPRHPRSHALLARRIDALDAHPISEPDHFMPAR